MDTQNTFLSASSHQLAHAFTHAAQDLSEHRSRSREERRELVERIRLLLLAGALRITPTGSWFARPEVARRPDDFLDALRSDHTQRLRELRFQALRQAAEYRLGAGAHNWLRDASRGPDRICDLALASENGLEAALEDLSQMAARNG